MREKYEAFSQFAFGEHAEYKSYIDGIYPAPTPETTRKHNKRFYKKFVDPDFDLTFDEPKTNHTPQRVPALSWTSKLELMLFALFLAILPLGIMSESFMHPCIIALALVLESPSLIYDTLLHQPAFLSISLNRLLFRMHVNNIVGRTEGLLEKLGRPKATKEYWAMLLPKDEFHDLVTVGAAMLCFSGTVVFWVPLIFTAILGIATRLEVMVRRSNAMARLLFSCFKPIFDSKEAVQALKADIETYAGFYIILAACFGWVSFLLPFFYWQLLQIRYILNERRRAALIKLADQMDRLIASPSCPAPCKWPLILLRKIGDYMKRASEREPEPQPEQNPDYSEESPNPAVSPDVRQESASPSPESHQEALVPPEDKPSNNPSPAESPSPPSQESMPTQPEAHQKAE